MDLQPEQAQKFISRPLLFINDPGVKQMIESKNRVFVKHPRAGKTHNLTNLIPVVRRKTVNRALGTGGFSFAQLAINDAVCRGV
jgi:hypothetical protein